MTCRHELYRQGIAQIGVSSEDLSPYRLKRVVCNAQFRGFD